FFFFFSSRRRHTRSKRDWSSDVCSSDLKSCRAAKPAGKCLAWRPRSSRFPNLLYRGFLTRKRFAASKASELATVLPIGNRRYGRFGNLRYVQRARSQSAAVAQSEHYQILAEITAK